MKRIFLILLSLSLVGCARIDKMVADYTISQNVCLGMSKQGVLCLIGTDRFVIKGNSGKIADNPYHAEILQGKEEALEIIYYCVGDKNRYAIIDDDKLIPLVFADDKLIGWGWPFLEASL